MKTFFVGLCLGVATVAYAQDSTTMLAAFLQNLRASHFIIGGSNAPTLSACGTGTLATGSTDTSGRATLTGSATCTFTFGASFGANDVDCMISNITANRGNVSATSKTAFTISNATAGDVIAYFCAGR
jgi:hypothetical protein